MVPPTKRKPRRLSSLLMRSEASVLAGRSPKARYVPCTGCPSTKLQR